MISVSFFPVILTILVTVTYSNGELNRPITITELFKISPKSVQSYLNPQLGQIYGARDCGGAVGRLLDARSEVCNAEIAAVCSILTNQDGRLEVDFVSYEILIDPDVRVTLTTNDGQSKSFVVPMPNTEVVAGYAYVLSMGLTATKELQDKLVTARLEFMRKNSKQVAVCGEGDFFVF